MLLKNNGVLPLKSAPGKIAVIGPTADSVDLHPRQLRRHSAASGDAAGWHIEASSRVSPILYAQGSTLAEGVGVPVPRTAFGLNKGLKTEFFATPDWTGRPVAVETEPAVQTDWENAKPAPEVDTRELFRALERDDRALRRPAITCSSLESGDSFPYSPARELSLHCSTAKCFGEGSLRAGTRHVGDGQLQAGSRRFAHRAAGA